MAPRVKPYTLDPDAPDYWQEACHALSLAHPTWQRLIEQFPDRALRTRGAPFETLLRSLVGQQISVKAADAVWGRVRALLPDLHPNKPLWNDWADALLQCTEVQLRAAGLSGQKVQYVKALAEFQRQGALDWETLQALDDTACSRHLCQVKGIGPWTAHMFLMFGLRRPDVWPIADLGVQRGISLQFMNGMPVGPQEAQQFGEPYKPWRTVAAWYLWRSLDPGVIDY